jgi:hypothetical protein
MIEILPAMEKYKYDTWRILPVKCNIDNFMLLQSCIQNVNREIVHEESSSSAIHFLIRYHKIFTWSQRWRKIGEISQKEDFDPRMEILLGGRTCLWGLMDKSGKPYWNPVKSPDISGVQKRIVRFAKPDTSVLTGQMIMKELRGILGAEIKRGMLIEST